MYIYIYVCVFIHVPTYIHHCKYVYTRISMCIRAYVYIHIYVCIQEPMAAAPKDLVKNGVGLHEWQVKKTLLFSPLFS